MKIAVIGTGYVGLVTGSYFANKGFDVVNVDVIKEKIENLNSGEIPFFEPGLHDFVKEGVSLGKLKFTTDYSEALKGAEVIFICVGTPAKNGEADLSFVESALTKVSQSLEKDAIIVGKSTLPIGITDWVKKIINDNKKEGIRIGWVVNPEFLSEGTAVYDMQNPTRVVIGGESPKDVEKVASLYSDLSCPIIKTDIESAVLIKYAANSLLATKVSFINAVANIADKLGADISTISYGLGLDPRIGDKFLKAGIGYGGSCFPKDILAFYKSAEDLGENFDLLKEVEKINNKQPEEIVKKLEKYLGDLKNKKITLLGLSFKPETDDIREAPSISLSKLLLEKGVTVVGNDPLAIPNFEKLGLDAKMEEAVYPAVTDADAVVLVTEWKLYYGLDWERIKQLMQGEVIIDSRNFLNKEKLKELGFKYEGVGIR